ncbi:MAG TPA: hypothetical protein VEF76_13700 [Patescibacteria group bacterium]|nr:hypothetical protein [Patescibacteria group bacterium]
MSPAGVLLFAADFLVILATGAAGFGINELVHQSLRSGQTPIWRSSADVVQRDSDPKLFSERITKWVIAGNLLLVASVANAVTLGILVLYRTL